MRWSSILAVVLMVVRSFAPCCFTHGANTPHTEMLLNILLFGASDHTHRHLPIPCFEMSTPNDLDIDSTLPLEFPFGSWNDFVSNFFLVALLGAAPFAILLLLHTRLTAQNNLTRLARVFPIDPPPRTWVGSPT
jgi:hypothetical protein